MYLVSYKLVLSETVVPIEDAPHTTNVFVVHDEVSEALCLHQINAHIDLFDSYDSFYQLFDPYIFGNV